MNELRDLIERLDRLEARNAALEAEVAALRHTTAAVPTPQGAAAAAMPDMDDGSVGRRTLLTRGLAAAGAATAGAMALGAQPAAADDGDTFFVGEDNTATSETTVTATGSTYAFVATGTPEVALAAITAHERGIGVYAKGTRSNLALAPRTSNAQPADDGARHQTGEVVVDVYGNLWYCHTGGVPGTWRSLSGPTHAGSFYPWTAPVRAYDSRPGTSPASPGPKTKLTAGQTRTINLRTSGAASPQSKGVLVQVLLVNAAAGNGNFTIWAGGTTKPLANTMVWGGNAGRFSTLAFTNVDTSGNVQVNASLATDLVLDVIGIYG